MDSQLRADQIGTAAERDQQIAVPNRPIVRRGVRFRKVGDTVYLDGSDRPQVFSGSFAREALATVVSTCDGSRDHEAIALATGIELDFVHKCLALLWASGAIEEASAADLDTPRSLSVFLSRVGNSTGANASWVDAASKLKSTPVSLSGDPALVAAATKALAGVCQVEPANASPDAILVFLETVSTGSPAEAQGLVASGKRFLRVRADSKRIHVGPYLDRAISPCYSCATSSDDALDGGVPSELVDLVAGVAAHHIVSIISRACISHLPMDTCVISTSTLASTFRPIVTLPGCPDCSFSVGPTAFVAPVGAKYEASVALPPRQFLSPRDHQAHYYMGNQRLQTQFKTWPSRAHTALPAFELDVLPHASAEPAYGNLSPEALSLILGASFGIDASRSTPDRVKRWTASGGNIGGNTAYVVLRDPSVFEPGVYAYSPTDHSLVSIAPTPPHGDAPCEIVIAGDLRKTMTKYGTFGLRLAFLDAGCSLTTMRYVSERIGLACVPRDMWNDAVLLDSLPLDPLHEPIVAVIEIGDGHEK
ncbi:hypothetical protein I6H91_07720 [Micrococcus luteus]|uniref:hypothetical protein n=1 Tax=Micrococcus luteus TaxID=1270 RepID=UPI001910B04A|nr:hypothetical protein [Micrococcus luteus]QQE48061.1 hypothetical protein I6H91_07720 [Micrococcus luteus]UTX35576.1 hypothetical protein NNL26_04945 [Micrococcus luteus]